jgi:protein-disulfide isomerase
MKRYLPFAIIAGVLIIALGGGLLLWRAADQTNLATKPFTQPSAATSPQTAQTTSTPLPPMPAGPDNPHVRGGIGAKVTLEEYGDYQCPPCGQLYPEVRSIEKEYGDQIRFVFRQFPLEMHNHAFEAAHAAEAAGLQGHFWEMHDLLYQNQSTWSVLPDVRPTFIQYATDLKLDADRFTKDMDSQEVANRVLTDIQRGKASGVVGTPTVFINGRQLRPEVVTHDGLRMALNYVLGNSK